MVDPKIAQKTQNATINVPATNAFDREQAQRVGRGEPLDRHRDHVTRRLGNGFLIQKRVADVRDEGRQQVADADDEHPPRAW
jgi:hypothetical protein